MANQLKLPVAHLHAIASNVKWQINSYCKYLASTKITSDTSSSSSNSTLCDKMADLIKLHATRRFKFRHWMNLNFKWQIYPTANWAICHLRAGHSSMSGMWIWIEHKFTRNWITESDLVSSFILECQRTWNSMFSFKIQI